jgi:hypothetical protein
MILKNNQINPVTVYQWLIENKPETPQEASNWLNLAESIKIYCRLPAYALLSSIHLRKLEEVAKDFGLDIIDHLDQFNRQEREINKLI